MRIRHSVLFFALTGCPWVGTDDFRDNVQDADGDGVVAERFGGRDCQDDNPAVGNCDADDDGYLSVAAGGDDCDDTAADIHPDAVERCDLIDNDCDGGIDADDADVVPQQDLWEDADGDGEGAPDRPVLCQEYTDPTNPQTALHVTNDDDCDDTRDDVHSAALERCDSIDNNCDGAIDDVGLWMRDDDGDGFGVDGTQVAAACDLADTTGVSDIGGDCDDTDPSIYLGAPEIPYDAIDQNCNGGKDNWDVDFDGHVPSAYFAAAQAINEALPPDQQWDIRAGDCDDNEPLAHVDAIEVCDGIDNDCDGAVDAADLNQAGALEETTLRGQVTLVYLDRDGDQHGGTELLICPSAIDPNLHFTTLTDCFDTLPGPVGFADASPASIHNDADEICDGIDNNCDDRVDWSDTPFTGSSTHYADLDGDGFGTVERQACSTHAAQNLASHPGDCDDGDPGRFPGAPEICGNAVREDCVTEICDDTGACSPVSVFDCDLDGFEGLYVGGGSNEDCDDLSPSAFPGNPEICDGVDNDSNGAIDSDDSQVDNSVLPDWYLDSDEDGFGDGSIPPLNQCDQPAGSYTLNTGDCDDTDPLSRPDGA